MKNLWKMAFLSTVFVLASCKGGGSGAASSWFGGGSDYNPPSTPTAQSGTISGTAATGAPMARADVSIQGDNCTLTTETNSAGVFSKEVANCDGPYLITVRGTKGTVYSVIDDAGKIANVNPITTIIAARVLDSADLESITFRTIQTKVNASEIAAQITQVKTALAPILSQFGATNIDPLSGAIEANGQGLDRVLDALDVKVNTGAGNLVVEVKGTNASVTIDEDGATPAPAPTNDLNNAASTVASSLGDLDLIQTAINGAFSGSNPEAYCTSDFKEWGYDCSIYLNGGEGGELYEYKSTRPSLVEISGNDAWVSFEVLVREKNANMDWIVDTKDGLMHMKKVNGVWKLYGNQVPHPLIFDATGWKYTNNSPSTSCTEAGYTITPSDPFGNNEGGSYGDNLFDLSAGMSLKINGGDTVVSVPFTQTASGYIPFIYFDHLEDSYKPCIGPSMEVIKIPESLTGDERFVKVELGYTNNATHQAESKVFYTMNPNGGNSSDDFSYDFVGERSADSCLTRITGFKDGIAPPGWYNISLNWDEWDGTPGQSQIGKWTSLISNYEYFPSFPYSPLETNYSFGAGSPHNLDTSSAKFGTIIYYSYENSEGKYITRQDSCTEDQTP